MGKLVRGTAWAKEQFEKGSRPGKDKILQWIISEEVPGQILGGEPYVDADLFAIRDHTGKIPAKRQAANDSAPSCGLDLLAS